MPAMGTSTDCPRSNYTGREMMPAFEAGPGDGTVTCPGFYRVHLPRYVPYLWINPRVRSNDTATPLALSTANVYSPG